MNNYNNHFDDYLKNSNTDVYKIKLEHLNDYNNIIIVGPSGIGKYTYALNLLKEESPSKLKYDKKMVVMFNKIEYFYRISDIHYEIDMEILGCNSRLLWHEIFNKIFDSILFNVKKKGFILCKNFNKINNELLDIFYSYLQNSFNCNIELKFIIISESVTFIPNNLLDRCYIINLQKLTKSNYKKILNIKSNKNNILEYLDNINNIKDLKLNLKKNTNNIEKKNISLDSTLIIVDEIYDKIIINDLDFLKLRETLYDICIYDLTIENILFKLINKLKLNNKINNEDLNKILIEIYKFLKLYNNNYRPIFHLERIIIYISVLINGIK
jgi:hypothetical protein